MYGVIGKPVLHSLSPGLYKDQLYLRIAVESVREILELKEIIPIKGINVTAPFKEDAFRLATIATENAKNARAANILIFEENKIFADNSDVDAVINLVKAKSGEALVLGGGGAGRAAKVALQELGFNVTVWNRSEREGTIQKIPDKKYDVVVNTVPDPPVSKITLDSRYSFGGLSWLVEQGRKTSKLFFNRELSEPDSLSRNFNSDLIYITGMMGAGKTTIGESLARKLSFEWNDTDKIIQEKEGRSINEIFQTKGEEYFRKLEQDVVSSLNKGVVSVGGGVVSGFKKNSLVVLLLQKKEVLKSRIQDRPLKDYFDDLYEKRMPKLLKASSLVIKSNEQSADRLAYEINQTFKN